MARTKQTGRKSNDKGLTKVNVPPKQIATKQPAPRESTGVGDDGPTNPDNWIFGVYFN
jgi:hypothetical protein